MMRPSHDTAIAPISEALEKIIRPIVEGQIRGFLQEHPSIVEAVDWYKNGAEKYNSLVGSLSKRILCDLLCGQSTSRIRDAVLARTTEPHQISPVALGTAVSEAPLAVRPEGADAT